MKTEQDLYTYLDSLSIKHQTYKHAPVFTVEEAEIAYKNVEPFGECKNLFLKDRKKRVWLVVALATAHIKLKQLAKELEAPELRFASPELLQQYLGVTPGAVSPFGLINDTDHKVHVILDKALFDHDVVGFHPLHNEATTLLSPADLEKFIKACGNPVIMKRFNQN